MNDIRFGTSGHRGIIGSTFTANHLRAIAYAIANYFKHIKCSKPHVLIGYDTRTGNSPSLLDFNSYTYTLYQALQSKKIAIDFCDSYTPTPVISWAVKHNHYNLGLILTASHNPPNYNGIKLNDSFGAPASSNITEWIEMEANAIFQTLNATSISAKPLKSVNYVNYMPQFIDHLYSLLKTKFKLTVPDFSDRYIIDPKCGSAIHIWRLMTSECIGNIHWINDTFSDQFNFSTPNPTSLDSINALSDASKTNTCIAISNDPDADRHVMIDEAGQFISPEKLTAIIIDYCVSEEIPIDSVSTTLSNSRLIKKICNHHGIQCNETKIGFKYFTPFLSAADNKNKLSIGVESSGGFSISYHTYDKCGFLPILIILGIMKKKNQTLHDLSIAINESYSSYSFVETSMTLSNESQNYLSQRLKITKEALHRLFELDINEINYNDGLKVTFSNDDWVLCRPSGTEPVIRIYAESTDTNQATIYCNQMKALLSDASVFE